MTLGEARARVPALEVARFDPRRIEAVHALVAAAFERVSARVGVWIDAPSTGRAALASPRGFLVAIDDDDALARLAECVGDLDLGPATIGVADGAFASACAARVPAQTEREPRRKEIAPGRDAAFLRALPVTFLPASTEAHAALHALGLRTLGEVAALPLEGALARLGEEGRRWVMLARGDRVAAIASQHRRGDPTAIAELCDERGAGVDSIDGLSFGLRAACERLLPSIVARGDGVTEAEVTLVTAAAPTRLQLRIASPERSPRALFELARATIEAARLSFGVRASDPTTNALVERQTIGPVLRVHVTATACAPLDAIGGRVGARPQDASLVRLDVALARLRGRFGTDHVVTPERREDLRPEARGAFVVANAERVHETTPHRESAREIELRERLRVPPASIGVVVVSRAPEVGDTWPIRSLVGANASTKRETIVAVERDERVNTPPTSARSGAAGSIVTYRWVVGSHGVRALFASDEGASAWRLVGIAD